MRYQIPASLVWKAYPQIFALIFPINTKAAFELNFESPVSIFVVCEKIGPLPVISKFDAVESIVGQLCSNFLKIVNFLLLRI